MWPFSTRKKTDADLELIVAVGSASVGAALVRLHPRAQKPIILTSVRKAIPFHSSLDSKEFMRAAQATIERVVEETRLQGKRFLQDEHSNPILPARVACSLSSPWHYSQPRIVNISRDTEFRVNKDMLAKIVEKQIAELKEDPQTIENIGKQKTFTIEKQIVQTKINGYETDSPYGKKTNSLSATILISVVPQIVADTFTSEIRKTFGVEEVQFRTFPTVGFTVTRDLFAEVNDFLFLDVTGEVTDVVLVHDDTLTSTVSFPVGKRSIIRSLIHSIGAHKEEALSMIRMYAEETLDTNKRKEARFALKKAGNVWKKAFEEALGSIQARFAVPHKVFLASDADMVEAVALWIRGEEWAQFTMTEGSFEVIPLSPYIFQDYVQYSKGVTPDTFISFNALYSHKLMQGGERGV